MSDGIVTPQEMEQMLVRDNRTFSNDIGQIKRRIADNHCLDNGVSTTFEFKKFPFPYGQERFSRIHIASYITGPHTAETILWGIESSYYFDKELKELQMNYPPNELPQRHHQAVQLIEKLHYEAYVQDLRQGVKEEEEEIPF